jgi:hypothetical protein
MVTGNPENVMEVAYVQLAEVGLSYHPQEPGPPLKGPTTLDVTQPP